MLTLQDKENVKILMEQMASTDLPPILDKYFKNPDRLFTKLHSGKIPIYNKINGSNYIELNENYVQSPKYLGSEGAEAIRYFSFKNNGSKRAMGILNPIYFFTFVYNSILAHNDWITDFYNSPLNNNIIKKSNSPILGLRNFCVVNYEDDDFDLYFSGKMIDFTNELNRKLNKSFEKNEEKSYGIEGSAPYFLNLDLENYYTSINTTLFNSRLFLESFQEYESNHYYFEFLSKYNSSVNDNQTKGILTGSISSFISAELLSIAIDSYLDKKEIKRYFRYVDDYAFFDYNQSSLENTVEIFDRVMRKFSLSRKFEKTILGKGFSKDNKANQEEIHRIFPFLQYDVRSEPINLTKDHYFDLKRYLKNLTHTEYVSQIKSTLTKIMNSINDGRVIVDEKIVIHFMPFLIKLSYSQPKVTNHVYRLIDCLCTKLDKKSVSKIIGLLLNDREYILNYFSESEFEIWFYYIITKYSRYDVRRKELNYYLNYAEKEILSTESLVLSLFIKNNFSENLLIFSRMKKVYSAETNIGFNNKLEGISKSRWWIILLALYKYFKLQDKKKGLKPKGYMALREQVLKYFYVDINKGDLNFKEMGIFCELL